MKIHYSIISLLVVAGIGYIFEPQIRYSLTGKTPDIKIVKSVPVKKEEAAKPTVLVDLNNWSADQLPKKVVLKSDAGISNEAGDLTVKVEAGSQINLTGINGSNAVISSGPGGLQGIVPISQTDLIEQLAQMKKDGFVNTAPEKVEEQPPVMETSEKVATVEPEAPEVAQVEEVEEVEEVTEGSVEAPETKPKEDVFSPFGDPVEEKSETPLVAETPEPEEVTSEEIKPATSQNSAEVVSMMKTSIENRDIKEFGMDQVTEWSNETTVETIDDKVYGVGMISYQAETVFGVKTIQAKALIQDGKVVSWLWPKSGMEIK